MTDATQNVINTLQERRAGLMFRIMQLEPIARRAAFEAVVNGSWKAKQDFRDAGAEGDRLADEIAMLDLALAEAYARLQTQGRDVDAVMRELKFSIGEAK